MVFAGVFSIILIGPGTTCCDAVRRHSGFHHDFVSAECERSGGATDPKPMFLRPSLSQSREDSDCHEASEAACAARLEDRSHRSQHWWLTKKNIPGLVMTNIANWKITMFNGKIHYFYGHFPVRYVSHDQSVEKQHSSKGVQGPPISDLLFLMVPVGLPHRLGSPLLAEGAKTLAVKGQPLRMEPSFQFESRSLSLSDI